MEFEYLVGKDRRKVFLEKRGDALVLVEGGTTVEADIRRLSEHEILVSMDGRNRAVFLAQDGDRLLVRAGGRDFEIRPPGRDETRSGSGDDAPSGRFEVRAPMPGKVIKLAVAEGQAVRRNQALVVVEAMKMENEIRSAADAVVIRVLAAVGDLVGPEKALLELEATPKSAEG